MLSEKLITSYMTMCSVHVHIGGTGSARRKFNCYVDPVHCLDDAKRIFEATKARSIFVYSGESHRYTWHLIGSR